MRRVGVLDYGMGNVRSVCNALREVGGEPVLVPPWEEGLEHLVLPGVGAFGKAMERLSPLSSWIRERVEEGARLLGICLGMQVMFEGSQEGEGVRGLGLLRGRVERVPTRERLPHMGWNYVRKVRESPLFRGVEGGYAYFVHSYRSVPLEKEVEVAVTEYGVEICAAVWKENLFGTQFHPEKSGPFGLLLLRNFLET